MSTTIGQNPNTKIRVAQSPYKNLDLEQVNSIWKFDFALSFYVSTSA
jgi:hypothetical protein